MLNANPGWYLPVRSAVDQALPNATPTASSVPVPGCCRVHEVGGHVIFQPFIFVIEDAQYAESRQLVFLNMVIAVQVRRGCIMLDLAQIVQVSIPG